MSFSAAPPFTKHHLTHGFSAIELLVAVAILAILGTLAAPSMVAAIERYRVNAIYDELIATIQLARVESIRRSAQVSLLRKTGCGATLTGTEDWSCGYELFVDTNANGAKNAGETVLQSAAIPTGYGLVHPNQGGSLRINIWGLAMNTGNKFVITPPDGVSNAATSAICLSAAGRIRRIAESASCP